MKWSRITAIVKKDVGEVAVNKNVVVTMIVVPVVLCIILPGVLLILALSLDTVLITGVQFFERIIPAYDIPAVFVNTTDKIMFIFLNFTFIPFFMLVPIMVSSTISANSVVGEKERKTLETLLYTPVTNKEFITGKLLSAFIPALVITFASFTGYFMVTNLIYGLIRGTLIVRSLIWIPAILLLSPAVSLLGLSITLLISIRAKTFMEAQQLAGVIVLPFVALVGIQIAGVVTFNALYVVIFSAFLFVLNYIIFSRIGPRFNRENIISTL